MPPEAGGERSDFVLALLGAVHLARSTRELVQIAAMAPRASLQPRDLALAWVGAYSLAARVLEPVATVERAESAPGAPADEAELRDLLR